MKHLIVCREYPPAAYPAGGIGTYVRNIAPLLAESGEEVHVIGELWEGAPNRREELLDGRLVVHRVPSVPWGLGRRCRAGTEEELETLALYDSVFPPQAFAWRAALLAERLVEEEGIDLIEAQEWEAPLYYFQLRRALGLGPAHRPPCLIHFHSPTELIVRSNDYDPGHRYFVAATRLEQASIAAADAYLCPSRYLARQVESIYDLPRGRVNVVPYPIGDTPLLERDPEVWERGSVCYVGRLEARKGVVEWIREAVTVAQDFPDVTFDFVGATLPYTDYLSVRDVAVSSIPKALRDRFRFRGETDRNGVMRYLAGARIAAVPSRWENFPNACIEAMCTGLPVVASREGGMVEMLEDGRTGWLGTPLEPGSLGRALRRALETPPRRLEAMGRSAAEAIREVCDNARTVERQLELRRRIASPSDGGLARLPSRSDGVPAPLPVRGPRASGAPGGIAVVVDALDTERSVEGCLQGLLAQTEPPTDVLVLVTDPEGVTGSEVMTEGLASGWRILVQPHAEASAARSAAVEEVLSSDRPALGFVFLNAAVRLRPRFLEATAGVLRGHPEVGLVTAWRLEGDRTPVARPPAAFPYQWVWNDALPPVAIRTEALRAAGGFRADLRRGFEDWDLCNGVLAAGYRAVTYPAILSEHERVWADSVPRAFRVPGYWRLRRTLLSRPRPRSVEGPAMRWRPGRQVVRAAARPKGGEGWSVDGLPPLEDIAASGTALVPPHTAEGAPLLPDEMVELVLLLESEVQRLVRDRFITVPRHLAPGGQRFVNLPLRARFRFLWWVVTNPRQSAPLAKWALTNPRKALLRLFRFRHPAGRRDAERPGG